MSAFFRRLLVGVAPLLTISACTTIDVKPAHLFSIEVPATGVVGQPVPVKVNGGLNDSCWAFDSITLQRGDSDHQYVVHAYEHTKGNFFDSDPCEEVPGAFQQSTSFVPTEPGDYMVVAPDIPASYTVVVTARTPTEASASAKP